VFALGYRATPFIPGVEIILYTVKPPIIPAGREQHEAGNKGMMERGGGVMAHQPQETGQSE